MSAAQPLAMPCAPDTRHAVMADWLAGLFLAPMTAAVVAQYRSGLGAEWLDMMAEEPGCAAAVRQMRAALAAPAAALTAAFSLLFDGVGGARTAWPYESAYLAEPGGHQPGRLFQAPVGQMEAMLRQCGISPREGFPEPADHLSVELALLAHLLRTGHLPWLLTALLNDHLLAWAPPFAGRCAAADAGGFYAGAARVLVAVLNGAAGAMMRETT